MFNCSWQKPTQGTEGLIMPFTASRQLLDPRRLDAIQKTEPLMMTASNHEILERGIVHDGEQVILSEMKLAEEVSFLCNNLTLINLPNKVEDMRRILHLHDDNCRKWLAQYLVMKLVTLEQSFHSLYNSFLMALNDEKLSYYVKQETLRNIKILLKSDKGADTSSLDDRQLLQKLGHWLGLITIGRNRPIILEELNLRDLVLEAFYKGQQELLYIIPFVAKIVMASSKSTVFSPLCSWIYQLLHMLAEIHRQADLNISLKLEIEVLCKELGVDLQLLVTDSPREIHAIIDEIPHKGTYQLRPIDRSLNQDEISVYNELSAQQSGVKPSPDNFGMEQQNALNMVKKKEEYQDNRHQVNERAREEMLADSTFIRSKAESIFRDWMNYCSQTDIQTTDQQIARDLFTLMQNHGIAINEDNILKQIKTWLEICTEVSYRLVSKNENSPVTSNVLNRCYYTIDAFSKLVCLLIRSGDNIQQSDKVQLLRRVLNLFANSLLSDHDSRRLEFNGLPFLRIFITMLKDLSQHDPDVITLHWSIVECFGHALYYVQPRRAPAFAFNWLEIIGHRVFISEFLSDQTAPQSIRAIFTQLLLAHLKFLAPSLRNVLLPKAVEEIYKGTLRIMLIVLHDFPELLCEYYYVLCDVIPPNCVQLRNLVLSAYPRNMRLPDPFSQNFATIERLSDMETFPKIPVEMFNLIHEPLRSQLDLYLTNRSGINFLIDLSKTLESSIDSGNKYNVPVLNAIVYFVGVRAITQLKESGLSISLTSIADSSYMDFFQHLTVTLCSEGRYLLFNALANQLRYPNAQTHFFSCTFLYLFKEAANDGIREQIASTLFERFVSYRPHPWGLLITFIELIRNDKYKFWDYEFINCNPDVERLIKWFGNAIKP